MTKRCSKCKQDKSVSEYSLYSQAKPKLKARCKTCCNQVVADWRAKNPEKSKASFKRSFEKKESIYRKTQRDKYTSDPLVKEKITVRNKKYQKENSEHFKRYHQDYYLKKKLGVSLIEKEAMILAQNNLCAICGEKPEPFGKQDGYCVDHCHTTGQIREILCNSCNMAIGAFKEKIEVMEKAIEYIKKHKKLLNIEDSGFTAKIRS